MEQHPIPQNVTQYQFRLIGNMTLKQFALLGGCGIIAYIISKFTFLPSFIRLPIAAVTAGLGVAFAFIPFEERTLDVWFINFIKAIYSPTQYLWRKQEKLPDFFSYSSKTSRAIKQALPDMDKQHQVSAYLTSLKGKKGSSLDENESRAVLQINHLFQGSVNLDHLPPAQPQPAAPPPSQPQKQAPIHHQEEVLKSPAPRFVEPQSTPPTQPLPPKSTLVETAPPLTPPLRVQSLYTPPTKPAPKPTTPQFLSEIPMLMDPDTPNMLTGMTLGADERLIPNAIIEVTDKDNLPVRAIKSNSLGQFFIATPLRNGAYTITAEHPDYTFDTIKLETKGDIIPPIKLIGKAGQI